MYNKINQSKDWTHYGYPSIEQFRNVIYNVNHKAHYVGQDENNEPIYDPLRPKPTLTFIGTTKLHGTNCGIIVDLANEVIYFQSRENVITPASDNAGAATFLASIQEDIVNMVLDFTKDKTGFDIVALYGEWCGGNIQKSVALNGLDKMFVLFDVALIDSTLEVKTRNWQLADVVKTLKIPEKKFYNIYDYQTWTIDIDFSFPQLSQNKLIEITNEVERLCPVGKSFGNEGIGEGSV